MVAGTYESKYQRQGSYTEQECQDLQKDPSTSLWEQDMHVKSPQKPRNIIKKG